MTDPVHESIPAAGEHAYRQGDSGESLPPRYGGPRTLAQALTRLARSDDDFTRDGLAPMSNTAIWLGRRRAVA